MKVNPKITKYIEENILTKYSKNNYGGHGKDHILEVIKRSFEIIDEFNLDVNHDIIYVVAAYHDIGYQENPDEHESVSSQLFLDDENKKLSCPFPLHSLSTLGELCRYQREGKECRTQC